MAVGLSEPEQLLPVRGVRLAAATAGLYPHRRPDTALLAISPGSVSSAVFTRNTFCAAPVVVARTHLQTTPAAYCLINAGNANAGTGERGHRDALEVCNKLAQTAGCEIQEVLPFSTGVIGEYLPVDKICRVIPELLDGLKENNWLHCARAIMTTDTVAKAVSRRISIDDKPVTITGIAKGAGMIKPDMATMLAYVATDAGVDQHTADGILATAVAESFNRISVDGDTSTNDACVFIATGGSDAQVPGESRSQSLDDLQHAVTEVCIQLAQAIVRDGEGATKFISIEVAGGISSEECLQAAFTVANSPLVKTACFASDPNWGRILAAIGRADIRDLDIARVSVQLNGIDIVARGERVHDYLEQAGQQAMAGEELEIMINLGRGSYRETVWTCDLSHEYVRINAEYRT